MKGSGSETAEVVASASDALAADACSSECLTLAILAVRVAALP